MIIRTYSCLNRRCQFEFDADSDFPPCPRCRGLRVKWIPRGFGIVSDRTTQIDGTAANLAANAGLTNFHTPARGRAAVRPAQAALMPSVPQAGAPMTFEPMPGWRITMPDSALQGRGHSVCMTTGVTAKVKVDPNQGPLKADPRVDLRGMTKIEASHRGKP